MKQAEVNQLSYRLFFEAGSKGMLMADGDGTVVDANPVACALLGRTREEMVGLGLDDLPDPSYPTLETAWKDMRATGSFHVTARLLRGDESSFPAEVSVVEDGEEGLGVIFKEIPRQTEGGAPRASAAEYRAMVERSVDAMAVLDVNNTFRYVNSAFEHLWGYKPEEIVGMFVPDIVHPEDLVRAAPLIAEIENNLGQGRIPSEFRYRHKSGHWTYLETTLNNLMDDPEVRGIVAICRDMTERKRLEEELRESEERLDRLNGELSRSNTELEQFAYVVSHGLRSPLRSVVNLSRELLEDYSGRLDEEGRESFRRLESSGLYMRQLVEDLLNLSRVTYRPLLREPVDLSALASSVAAVLQEREPGREVEVVIEEDLVSEGDPGLLLVVLENLVSNAWKYTSRKPRAKIEFGVVNGDAEGGGARVYFVRDDGAGFDGNLAGELFEPFRRLHAHSEFEGTGIGLATVKRIVSRHGGRVWAEGEVGRGAAFFFTLEEGP